MRKTISLILNFIIVVFGIIGTFIMFTFKGSGTGLTSSGIQNFKFFTVLSNELCVLIALAYIVFRFMKKSFPVALKLMATAAVGLTFIVVAAFLAPIYPDLNLYEGGNLWFHLIIPLTSMIEFLILENPDDKKIPFRYTFYSASFALIYGLGYLINILINGVGQWPDTNDWYGFLNWGYPIGICIFAFIVFMNWLIAVILRILNIVVSKRLKVKE
ncbi:MAG: hypothetical protein K6E28_03585 [Eubacterium sp.]|nr:hypothetical protein [Eubacterium sp.]